MFVNQLTFGSAHGLQVGSVVTLAGYTPAPWNATWFVASVPTTTTLTFLSIVSLGPVTVHGTATASVYGSQVSGNTITPAPNRFTTFLSEGIKLDNPSIESAGIGGGRRVQLATRQVKDRRGAAGPFKIELESKGLGWWFDKLIGPVVTTGPTDSAFSHTFSMPSSAPPAGLLGKSFNFQGTVVPSGGPELVKTYIGGKVISWQLDFAVGQLATLTVNADFMDELLNITKATASLPVNPELLSFVGTTIQFAGTTWDVVKSGSIKVDMGLDADRRMVRGNSLQREPAEANMRVITVDLDGEFDNVLTAYARYASNVAANAVAQINIALVGRALIGASTFPSLTFNIPVGRFDGDTPTTDGPGLPMQHVTAKAMYDGTNSPINAVYVTTDSTP
jgi:hypothetical protein